jgi:site-specific recombinase XerC
LTKPAVAVLKAWIAEQGGDQSSFLFPSSGGGRLSADAVQHLVTKHVAAGQLICPSLAKKRVTPHVLRQYAGCRNMPGGTVFHWFYSLFDVFCPA